MTRIVTSSDDAIPPFTVVLIDANDAHYYADIFDDEMMTQVITIDDLGKARAIADAYFVLENYKWKSLEDMISRNTGIDVRIYNKEFACIYAAHIRFQDRWIGEE